MVPGVRDRAGEAELGVTLRDHAVFVGGAAQRGDALEVRELLHDPLARGAREEAQGHVAVEPLGPGLGGGGERAGRALGRDEAGTLAGGGLDPVVHDGIVEQAPDGFAPAQDGEEDAEDRKALGEVPGAVHGVDDDAEVGGAHGLAGRGVGGHGLLARDGGLGPGGADGGGDLGLGLGVGQGHEVGGAGLGGDVRGLERPEARHDPLARGLTDRGEQEVALRWRDRGGRDGLRHARSIPSSRC